MPYESEGRAKSRIEKLQNKITLLRAAITLLTLTCIAVPPIYQKVSLQARLAANETTRPALTATIPQKAMPVKASTPTATPQ